MQTPYVSFETNGREVSLSAAGLGPAQGMPQECLSGDFKRIKENTWPLCRHSGLPRVVPPVYETVLFSHTIINLV